MLLDLENPGYSEVGRNVQLNVSYTSPAGQGTRDAGHHPGTYSPRKRSGPPMLGEAEGWKGTGQRSPGKAVARTADEAEGRQGAAWEPGWGAPVGCAIRKH